MKIQKIVALCALITISNNVMSLYFPKKGSGYGDIPEAAQEYHTNVVRIDSGLGTVPDAGEQVYVIKNGSMQDIAITIKKNLGDTIITQNTIPVGFELQITIPDAEDFPLRSTIKPRIGPELKRYIKKEHRSLTYGTDHELRQNEELPEQKSYGQVLGYNKYLGHNLEDLKKGNAKVFSIANGSDTFVTMRAKDFAGNIIAEKRVGPQDQRLVLYIINPKIELPLRFTVIDPDGREVWKVLLLDDQEVTYFKGIKAK